jgi:hypothetical protein
MTFRKKHNKTTLQKSLDDRWFGKYKKIATFQDYEYLVCGKNWERDQKNKFLKKDITNPVFKYPRLDKFNFENKFKKLSNLRKEVVKYEPNEIVKEIYVKKIDEKIIELKMLKSAKNMDDLAFFRYSKSLYGIPKKEFFYYTLSQIQGILRNKNRRSHEYFDSLLNKWRGGQKKGNIIPSEKINIVKPGPFILPIIERGKVFNANGIKNAFEQALKKMVVDGFKVIINSKGKCEDISVDQGKNIIIPEKRKVSRKKLISLIAHEIGAHVQREINGENSKLKLLSLGLDHYLKGEEGLATYMEQRLCGFVNYAGLNGYLAVSLATGIDGKKRKFREVFDVFKNYYLLMISHKRTDKRIKQAENFAWSRCVRVFRGTTGKTPGACFTKDIVYREGNIGIWKVVIKNPRETRRFFAGKYDPSNPHHIRFLDQLGVK